MRVIGIDPPPQANPEEQLHRSVVSWLVQRGTPDTYWFHPANGGKRSKATAGKMKAMGVRRGTPDLCFVLAGGRVAFMELKAPGRKPTTEQQEFIDWCDERGIPCPVVSDIDNALLILRAWKAIRPSTDGGRG